MQARMVETYLTETGAPVLLRVLSGVQSGAETTLAEGARLVGAGDGCDLVLIGEGVAEAHAALSLHEGRLVVEARDAAALLHGRRLEPGETAEFDLPAAIALGDVRIAIGDADTSWSDLPAPGAGIAPTVDEKPSDAAAEAPEPPVTAPEKDREPGPAPTDPTASDRAEEEEPTEAGGGSEWRKGALAAAVICLVLGTGYWALSRLADQVADRREASSAIPTPDPTEVRHLLQELAFAEARAVVRDDRVRILGTAPDDAAIDLLRATLSERGLEADVNLVTHDSLVAAAAAGLSAYAWPQGEDFGDHLRAHYAGSGVVSVSGFLGEEVDRDSLRRSILSREPRLAGINFERSTLASWAETLRRDIDAAGLSLWLSVDAVDGRLRVAGRLNPREAALWRSVGQRFLEKSGGWPRIAIEVFERGSPVAAPQTPPPAPPTVDTSGSAPDLRFVGTVTSSVGASRAILGGGGTYAEGEAITGGWTVKRVQPHAVVLERDGVEVTYRLEEMR